MGRVALLNKNNPSYPPFTKGGITSKKGLTLVEVMIALVVVLVVFLALMQTALVGIDSNIRNILRDEAVSIAEMRMNKARNLVFDTLITEAAQTVRRQIRNIKDPSDPTKDFPYTITRIVTDLNTDNKQVNITVSWTWKGANYTHSITTILRRQ